MNPLRHFLVVCFVVVTTPNGAAGELSLPELQQRLGGLLDHASVKTRATLCLKVIDVANGEVLFDRDGNHLLTPASNLKIYTAACALDTFGPNKRFDTVLTAPANMDHGTLPGDLWLVGGGDSMFTSADLSKLVDRAVEQWGLQRILGEVRVDNTRYGSPLKGPGWMWDDDPADYNMSVTPLMMDFNVLTVRVTESKTKGLSAKLVPASDYPPIRLAVGDRDGSAAQVTRKPFRDEIIVEPGKLGEAMKDFRLTMHNPGPWAAGLLERMLKDRGARISGADLAERDSNPSRPENSATLSLRNEGVTLAATIEHLNHESENAVAEVLLHEVAISKGTKRPTWSDGAQTITKWLIDTAGLVPDSFRLVDGSGLSRYNLISADSSVRLLKYMHGHKHFDVFFKSLKTYAVDLDSSVLSDRDPDRVHAKPGGMSGVSTISGYVRTLDGELLAFSLLANGYPGSNAPILELRQDVWKVLVQYQK